MSLPSDASLPRYAQAMALLKAGKSRAETAAAMGTNVHNVNSLIDYARLKGIYAPRRNGYRIVVRSSPELHQKLKAAAWARGLKTNVLVQRLVEAAAECVDAVLDDGRGRVGGAGTPVAGEDRGPG